MLTIAQFFAYYYLDMHLKPLAAMNRTATRESTPEYGGLQFGKYDGFSKNTAPSNVDDNNVYKQVLSVSVLS